MADTSGPLDSFLEALEAGRASTREARSSSCALQGSDRTEDSSVSSAAAGTTAASLAGRFASATTTELYAFCSECDRREFG